MISLPANVTSATVPSRKEARKELATFLRGHRARAGTRDREPAVPAFLHALLRQVEPYPAAVQNARWDILAFNRSYDALFGLESVPVRNRTSSSPTIRPISVTRRPSPCRPVLGSPSISATLTW